MRQPQLIIILGANGTGKTTLVRRLINAIPLEKKLIVTPDPFEWNDIERIKRDDIKGFTGTKRLVYKEGDMLLLSKRLNKSVVVFDDFKALFLSKQAEINALRSLVIRRRQRMLDIFIIGHGFTEIVPSYLLTFANKIILFKTLDNPYRVKDRFLDFDKIREAQAHVNEKATKDIHYYRIINLN